MGESIITNIGKINFSSIMPTMSDWMKNLLPQAEAEFRSLGERVGAGMVDGIKSAFSSLLEWFKGLGASIIKAIGKIDFSSIIPTLPDWMTNLLPQGAKPTATGASEGSLLSRTPTLLPANNNGRFEARPSQGTVQKVDTGGTLRIIVDPGIKVASATPNDKSITYTAANTGRAIGRS